MVDLWSGVCGFADGRWLVVAGVKLVEMVGSQGGAASCNCSSR